MDKVKVAALGSAGAIIFYNSYKFYNKGNFDSGFVFYIAVSNFIAGYIVGKN
jgi:hypothetical protein